MKVDIRLQPKESSVYSFGFLKQMNEFMENTIIKDYNVPPYNEDLHYQSVPIELLRNVLDEIKRTDIPISLIVDRISSH